MNRNIERKASQIARVPHTRGDEPQTLDAAVRVNPAFPTPVGMNR